MRIKHVPEDWLKKEIRQVAQKYLDLDEYELFIFGSRVAGNNLERSDIDVGIRGPHPLSVKTKMMIEEELERLPTLYKFDLVDFQQVDPNFMKQALKRKEPI